MKETFMMLQTKISHFSSKDSSSTKDDKPSDQEVLFSCHLCDYQTSDVLQMNDHSSKNHGFIHCDKCEYIAEESTIMKKHMLKHTGSFNFTSTICEFEATKESLLEEHYERKHKKNKEVSFQCEVCVNNVSLRSFL